VRPLAERAASATGAEQTAARAALGTLKGRAVDAEIVSQLRGKPADAVAAELILAVGERRNFSAKPLITSSLTSVSPAIRTQAYRALRAIGTPSDMPVVLDALLVDQSEAERTDAEKTVVALSQKLASADGRSAVVRTRLAAEKGTESRVRLIGLLGQMGDTAALPVLRSALKDPQADVVDAAVRAMAAWPTSAAREDLLALARDLRNETHRLLAIRGLIRTIGLDTYRDARAVVADLRLAAGFAWRSDEQKLVLGVLGRFPCVEALDLARTFLQDPSLKAEAQAAIDRITPRLPKEAIR
jgi:HEAT repeat protein